MKFTYNLENMALKLGAAKEAMKADLEASIEVKGVSVTVEFSVEEMTAAGQAALAMRNAAVEGFQKIAPIVKDAIIEIGKAGSAEIEKHRILDDNLSAKKQERSKIEHERWRERFKLEHNHQE